EAHPGGNGNRGDNALQAPVRPYFHEAPDIGQVFKSEEQFGGGAVEAQDQDLHGKSDSPSIAGPLEIPSEARIVGARSTSRAPSRRKGRFMNKTPGTSSGSMM